MGKVDLDMPMYARLLARLACRRNASLQQVLDELGVDANELQAAEPALRRDLSMAWQERKGIAAMKFAAALGEELSKLGSLSSERAGSAGLAGDSSLPEVEPPRGNDVPSFLQPAPVQARLEIKREPPPPHLAGTADMDLHAIVSAVKGGSLPFAAADPQTTGRALERSPTDGERPHPTPTGTVLDLSGIIPRSSLPFAPEAPAPAAADDADFAQLPLTTYASVTSALARGEPRDEVLQRHGVRPEVFDAMAKAWAQRFQREPHLLETFKGLVKRNGPGK